MFKTLLKWFSPSASAVADLAAGSIQRSVNSATEGREAVVAKYAAIAAEASAVATRLSDIMADGKIDNDEKKQLASMLTPLSEKILAIVKD